MKFETFRAGSWQPRYQYKSFEPVPVNHEWIWEEPKINVLLEQATRALSELNDFVDYFELTVWVIRLHSK